MNQSTARRVLATFLVAIAGLFASSWALADPPSRVARLAYISGGIGFSPAGERDWVHAGVNRPLVTGDRLWVGEGARAELQLGSAAIRAGGGTSLTLLNLDDRVVQVQLSQGTLNIRVRRLDRGQVFEIDTPNLAYSIRRPGSYRIEVDPDGGATTVTARKGLAEVYGEGAAFITAEGRTYRFYGSGLRDYQTFAVVRPDPFDRWSSERDRRWDTSASRRYVSPELIGYEDLDAYGSWRKVRDYGSVWVPHRVAADWAPYRDGHWAWVEPWGWTWIDEAPWGFAPSHYGRWARIDNTWAWVPGPATARPVYAPALVAFVGGSDARPGGGGTVAWFPLGPRDVYRPSYAASREYFNNVNASNTVISRSDIGNRYGNGSQASVSYSNQQVAGAVVAVLAAAFAESRPVHREAVRVTPDMFSRAPVAAAPPVAPVRASVVGPASASGARPPEAAQARPVIAQVAPPPPPVPFAAKQSALAANAGKALDAEAMARFKAAATAEAPAVKVVTPTQAVAAPPRPASAPAAPPAAVGPAAPVPGTAARPPRTGERGAPAPSAIAPPVAPAPGPAAGPAAAPDAARASAPAAPAAAAAPAPAGRPEWAPSRGNEPQAGRDRTRASREPEAANAAASGSIATSPAEERARRQAPATAKPPESPPPARPTVTMPVAPPAPPVAAPPVAVPPVRPATPPMAAPVAPSAAPAAPAAPSFPPQRATPAVPPTPPAAAAPLSPPPRAVPAVPPKPPAAAAPPAEPPRAVPAVPPTPPAAAAPPSPPPRAVPAVPPKPPAAAAPPAEPPRAVPAVPPTPSAAGASAAQPAPAAAPDQRGPRARAQEGGAPGRRDAASEARGKRDEEAQGRKP